MMKRSGCEQRGLEREHVSCKPTIFCWGIILVTTSFFLLKANPNFDIDFSIIPLYLANFSCMNVKEHHKKKILFSRRKRNRKGYLNLKKNEMFLYLNNVFAEWKVKECLQ